MKNSERIIPAEEAIYLEGPQSRTYELGFVFTVFGSARFKEDNQYYKDAREFGKRIAEMGFTTMTGGGPGIMEAANRGAFEAGGMSVGLNIKLPFEQSGNPYVQP